jgi:vacuolar iron transporter family protein
MNKAIKVGIGFGLTSATITTLGLIIGLDAGTGSKLAVAAGILTIAVADSFSDALGVHIAKESEGNFSEREIWQATIYTFLCKFFFALTFLIPVLLLKENLVIIVAIIWGFLMLIVLNYHVARTSGQKPLKVIAEHLLIAIMVIILSRGAGLLIGHWLT